MEQSVAVAKKPKNGTVKHYVDGKLHRDDGPALEVVTMSIFTDTVSTAIRIAGRMPMDFNAVFCTKDGGTTIPILVSQWPYHDSTRRYVIENVFGRQYHFEIPYYLLSKAMVKRDFELGGKHVAYLSLPDVHSDRGTFYMGGMDCAHMSLLRDAVMLSGVHVRARELPRDVETVKQTYLEWKPNLKSGRSAEI